MSCLDSSTIPCNGGLLCCVKVTNVLILTTSHDPCSKPDPILDHTSVSNRVVGSQFFHFRFIIHRNFVLIVQFGWWTSCLHGSTIVRSGSLLGCVKYARVVHFAINAYLCFELLPYLRNSFILDFFLRFVLVLSLSFWHYSVFPLWLVRTDLVGHCVFVSNHSQMKAAR